MAATPPFSVLDREGFSSCLNADFGPVEPILINPYCAILRTTRQGDAVILKQYRPEHIHLAGEERTALLSWSAACAGVSGIYATDCLGYEPGRGVIAIQFVPGMRLSDTLRQAARNPSQSGPLLEQCARLGTVLANWRRTTALERDSGFHPHYRDYIAYLARKLGGIGLGVGALFRSLGEEVESRIVQLESCGDAPSRTHGDLVPRNIHVDSTGIGVVDLANSLANGHPYDDGANFRLALKAMGLPRSFEAQVLEAVMEPLAREGLSEGALDFFREYHRQRWLMLRLTTRSPRNWADALRGLAGFARACRRP
jgi:hypothetical protein